MVYSHFVIILLICAFQVAYCEKHAQSPDYEAYSDVLPDEMNDSNKNYDHLIANEDYYPDYQDGLENNELSNIHVIRFKQKFQVSCQNVTFIKNTVRNNNQF